MLRAAVLLLILSMATGCSRLPGAPGPEPRITMAPAPPPELGPPPDEIPAAPREVIVLRPGGELTEDQLDHIEARPGYVAGSAAIEAVYPGEGSRKEIVSWEERRPLGPHDPQPVPMSCQAINPVGELPENWGCGTSGDDDSQMIDGMGYTFEDFGDNLIEVHHTGEPEATVVELTDGSTFVIRPGESSISYHEWHGPPSARVTVFWPDGSSQSSLTTP